MLANALVTNEVKNSAGTEVQFQRLSIDDRQTVFAYDAETPAYQHRLSVKHQEIGSGADLRRRSLVRIDKTVAGVSGAPRTVSCYITADFPIGDLATYDEPKNVIAELLSFCASLGASTTILYDGSGNGSQCLLTGGL
jgi:hypothetical protein